MIIQNSTGALRWGCYFLKIGGSDRDPLDQELKATLLAAELVLRRDRHCLIYTRAYRAGVFH